MNVQPSRNGGDDSSKDAQDRAEAALQDGLASIHTPADADRAIQALETAAANLREADVADLREAAPPARQAAEIQHAAEAAPEPQKAAAVIAEAATQIAAAGPQQAEMLDRAIAGTTGTPCEPHEPLPSEARSGRSLLRKALFKRLRPIDKADAALFLAVNDASHPRWLNDFMRRLSIVMNGGMGWLLPLAWRALRRPKQGGMTALDVLPPLWLATSTVEYPVKAFFRRRRPFISLVRAIVVGKKPGSYSFPSGHTAAAFAGALLLSAHFPRQRSLLYTVASLVGFSRVYLGAHYPGDVVMGGLAGTLLAKVFRAGMRVLTHALRS